MFEEMALYSNSSMQITSNKMNTFTMINIDDNMTRETKTISTLDSYRMVSTTHGNDTLFFQYPPILMDLAAVLLILFAIVGIAGNFISILALSNCKRLRNATTAFIVNLCVADFLFCCFSIPLSAVVFLERDWNYGDILCQLIPLVRYSNGAVSLFSVIAIAINRYILVVHPSLYRDMYKPRCVAVMIFFIWLCALALLFLPLLEIWGRFGFDPKVGTCSILKMNGKSPKTFIYIAAFTVPSIVFIFCYARIFWVVHKASKQIRNDVRKSSIDPNSVTFSSKKGVFHKDYKHSEMPAKVNTSYKPQKAELKVLKVMLVIFITFLVCYFPVSFVKIFKKEYDLPVLNVIGYMGVYFSNIINPVIYVLISKEYKKAYTELFCKKCDEKLTTNTT
ncbi:G-protein coupled receptor moody isoform X1 [Parasteatoda tepidariorum]|uniref:G-protein coupled receptor moody isoform X1 n=2 Tax=Parasteatoda tepidariorum TaxID=114398 RepID=UPI001C7220E6|nr:G-protein coupled receptor moody isoform X1 [Parasteatoda tepidariorum]